MAGGNTVQNRKLFKIVIIGDSGVGKSSLSYRFCEGKFVTKNCTVGLDLQTKVVTIDGEHIKLQIWDTAGQERYRNLASQYYRNTDAVVLVYDVTDPKTFTSLVRWIEEINLNGLSGRPRVLIGNKCDGVIAVHRNQAQMFAAQHNMPLFELSVKMDDQSKDVEAVFITLARQLKNYNKKEIPGFVLKPLTKVDTTNKKTCC